MSRVRSTIIAPVIVLVAVVTSAACATLGPPPPPADAELRALALPSGGLAGGSGEVEPILARALSALGGEASSASARVRTEEIERHAFTAGQSEAPGDPLIESARTRLRWCIDPDARALVVLERHRPIYPYPFPTEFDVQEDMRGGRGFLRGEDDAQKSLAIFLPLRSRPMTAARVAMREKIAWMSSPYEIVLAARAGTASRVEIGTDMDDVVRFSWRGLPMVARFDGRSGRILDLNTVEDDPMEGGDVAVRVAFDDWGDSGLGTVEPRRIAHFVNGELAFVDVVVRRTPGATKPDLRAGIAPPGSAKAGRERAHFMLEWMAHGFPQDDAGEDPVVTLHEIAPGVHMVAGAFHNSLVVELDEKRLALVEVPFSSERAEAIFAAIEQHFPGRKIDFAVQSHWHLDHSAGLRAAIARGIPIYAGATGAASLAKSAARPRTVIPDALALAPKPPHVTVVAHETTLPGTRNALVITPVASLHARDMLFISVPNARVLFVADEINPGMSTPNPALSAVLDATVPFFMIKAGSYAADLAPYLKSHDIALIVGGHGAVTGTVADVDALIPHADVKRFREMTAAHQEVQ